MDKLNPLNCSLSNWFDEMEEPVEQLPKGVVMDFSKFVKLFEDMQQKHRAYVITCQLDKYSTNEVHASCAVYEEAKALFLDYIKDQMR